MMILRLLVIACAIAMIVAIAFLFTPKAREGIVLTPYGYPCAVAEISPDIPVKIKEECRKLRDKR